MGLSWHREEQPHWDEDKKRIIGGAPDGVFDLDPAEDESLSGDWWSAQDDGTVVGYAWLDSAWGDAEILLAVDPHAQQKGVGSYVLENIEHEAATRGMNYVYNTVRATHPERAEVQEWLESRGFSGDDRDNTLRKHVRAHEVAPSFVARAPKFDASVDMPPGREESGGYVDSSDHRF